MNARSTDLARLKERLPLLVFLFCVAQPLLDVLSYWQSYFALPGLLISVPRALLILSLLLAGYLCSRRRKLYWILGLGLLAYLAGHLAACSAYGAWDVIADLTAQARILLIPMMTLAFLTILRQNESCLQAMERGFAVNMASFVLIAVLSTVTGTDPHTYYEKEIGVLGWFVWGNSQSAILSILTPIIIAWTQRRFEGRLLPTASVAVICFGLLYACATRLAYATLIASGLGLSVCLVITDRKKRSLALTILLIAGIYAGFYPLSPTHANQQAMKQTAQIKQQRIDAAVSEFVEPGTRRTEDPRALAAAYHYYLQGMVDRFGLERVAKAYDYSIDQKQIFDRRAKLLRFCGFLMEDAPAISRVFGLPSSSMQQWTSRYSYYRDEWTDGPELFDVENDLHGIYFQCGLAGLIPFLIFLLAFGVHALAAMLRRFRAVFSFEFCAFAGAYCYLLLYAYYTSSVVRWLNTSVYLAAILAGLWLLSSRRAEAPAEPREVRP